MNATLQAIWDKVQTYIRAKISSSPDPTKILAEHTAELFEETLTEVDAIKTDLSNVARLDGYNEFTGVLGLIYDPADVDARFFVYVDGEAIERLTMNKEGKFQLSDGTTLDPLATWFRQSAGRMATDGKFNAIGGLQNKGADLIAPKTGTVIDFRAMTTQFGSLAAAETGNYTADLTGAVIGHVAVSFHNSGTEPTFTTSGVTFNKISGTYALGETNRILFHYVGSSTIDYMIQ